MLTYTGLGSALGSVALILPYWSTGRKRPTYLLTYSLTHSLTHSHALCSVRKQMNPVLFDCASVTLSVQ